MKPNNCWRDLGWESITWAYASKRYIHVRMIVFYFGRIKKIYKHVRFVIQVDGTKVVVRVKRKRKCHARFCSTFQLCHDCIDCSCRGTLLMASNGIRRKTISTTMSWDIYWMEMHENILIVNIHGLQLVKPLACYVLNRSERNRFLAYLRSVRFFDGYSSSFKWYIRPKDGKTSGWKVMIATCFYNMCFQLTCMDSCQIMCAMHYLI